MEIKSETFWIDTDKNKNEIGVVELTPAELAEQMSDDDFELLLTAKGGVKYFSKPNVLSEPKYPCQMCGKLRTKEEGGTTFTVCDECWDKTHKKEWYCTCPVSIQHQVSKNYCTLCHKPIPPTCTCKEPYKPYKSIGMGIVCGECNKPLPVSKTEVSKCCNASVHTNMSPDFIGDNPKTQIIGTCYYICDKCGEACDVVSKTECNDCANYKRRT